MWRRSRRRDPAKKIPLLLRNNSDLPANRLHFLWWRVHAKEDISMGFLQAFSRAKKERRERFHSRISMDGGSYSLQWQWIQSRCDEIPNGIVLILSISAF